MDTNNNNDAALQEKLSFDNFRNAVLSDYQCACESRETSLLGRREVLTGKAKFGIFGDGKEIAQVAAAKFFTVARFGVLPMVDGYVYAFRRIIDNARRR